MQKRRLSLLVPVLVLVAVMALMSHAGTVTPANSSFMVFPSVTVAVTNGQSLTITNSFESLTCAGANTTVTNTMATPTHGGMLAILQLAAGQTNDVIINSDSIGLLPGNERLAAGGKPLVLISSGTNYWYEFITPEGTNLVAGFSLPAVNGSAITNLSGANISAGDIALARLRKAVSNELTTGPLLLGSNVIVRSVNIQNGITTNFVWYGVAANTEACITNRFTSTNGITWRVDVGP